MVYSTPTPNLSFTITSPPNPRKKALNEGSAWQLTSFDPGVQLPKALLEFALSMPDLLALAHAPPNPTLTSIAVCALANGIEKATMDTQEKYRANVFKIRFSSKKFH